MKVEGAFIPHPSSLILDWLGGRDSNPDSQIQSLESYHWTTSQQEEFEFTYRGWACQPTKKTYALSSTPAILNLPATANSAASVGRYSQCHDSFETVRTKPCLGAFAFSHS